MLYHFSIAFTRKNSFVRTKYSHLTKPLDVCEQRRIFWYCLAQLHLSYLDQVYEKPGIETHENDKKQREYWNVVILKCWKSSWFASINKLWLLKCLKV